MKVYVCYECYYDYCEIWKSVMKVFDCEVKALVWKEKVEATETDWREYIQMEVE